MEIHICTMLTLKKYFNSRLLNCDTRFASNIEYLFFAQYRTEEADIQNAINIALRKSKGAQSLDVNAGQLKDPSKLQDIITNDLGYHFLQKVRGSPALFQQNVI